MGKSIGWPNGSTRAHRRAREQVLKEYEDALMVAEAIRPWCDEAYAKALAGLGAHPGDPLLGNHIAAARETADDG